MVYGTNQIELRSFSFGNPVMGKTPQLESKIAWPGVIKNEIACSSQMSSWYTAPDRRQKANVGRLLR